MYWGAVMIVVTALVQQRTEGFGVDKCREMFGVCRLTLQRWLSWFREIYPQSAVWQSLRCRLMPTVKDDAIPSAVLERLQESRGDPFDLLVRGVSLLSGVFCA